jgi:hypothetical protein
LILWPYAGIVLAHSVIGSIRLDLSKTDIGGGLHGNLSAWIFVDNFELIAAWWASFAMPELEVRQWWTFL